MPRQVKARVSLTVVLSLTQPWDPKETVENVVKAAKREAIEAIDQLIPFADDKLCRTDDPPTVLITLVERED